MASAPDPWVGESSCTLSSKYRAAEERALSVLVEYIYWASTM